VLVAFAIFLQPTHLYHRNYVYNILGDAKGRNGGFKGQTNCFRIIKMIMERNFAPVIVFSFSKKDCEAYALQMAKIEFNTKVSPMHCLFL